MNHSNEYSTDHSYEYPLFVVVDKKGTFIERSTLDHGWMEEHTFTLFSMTTGRKKKHQKDICK